MWQQYNWGDPLWLALFLSGHLSFWGHALWVFHSSTCINVESRVNAEPQSRSYTGSRKFLHRLKCFWFHGHTNTPPAWQASQKTWESAEDETNSNCLRFTMWHLTPMSEKRYWFFISFTTAFQYASDLLPSGSRLRFSDGQESKGGYKLCRYCWIYELCSFREAFSSGNILTTYTSHFISWWGFPSWIPYRVT